MASVRDDVAGALVAGASSAADLAGTWTRVLDVVRGAWRAERAVLVRREPAGATALVATVPAPARAKPFDVAALARALTAETPVTVGPVGDLGLVLAVGLRPGGDGRWCVGLARPGTPWTAAERRGLADLRPHLELIVDHALLRAEVEAARAREGVAAEEHERFLNVISHELRNPLAPILMWTSTLRRLRPVDADVQRATQAIANAVNLERRLIEELLDLSRLERGALELALETVDLREVVRAIADERAAAAAEAQLTLEHDAPTKPVPVHGDRSRLDQIVRALVENAIKFTPAGGRVRMTLARRGARAEITVVDSGGGIPADLLERLFTPFVKGRNARGGLGLGLPIARLLVARHRGTLEASNPPEGGARLVVSLPFAPAT